MVNENRESSDHSTSVSLRTGEIESRVSSVPIALSFTVTGTSFRGEIVSVPVATRELFTPSDTWKVKVSVPLKLRFGV